MNTGRRTLAGAGIQTAALGMAGYPPNRTDCEKYDGTSWSTTASMATARRYTAGCGTQAAGLGFGGYAPGGKTNATEEFTDTANVSKVITSS